MYTQRKSLPEANRLICPGCKGTRFRINSGKVVCTNCDWTEKRGNKYGAKRQVALDGIKRDSGYEAEVANELRFRKLAGDIKDYDSQYKVEVWCYRADGQKAFKVSHKVDFRIHHTDGSYELLEAKGVILPDYQWRRKFLEEVWLPEHPDHIYTVVKQSSRRRRNA